MTPVFASMFSVGLEKVNCWSLCAKRLGIVKDIRILIGEMIWPMVKYDGYVTNKHHFCKGTYVIISWGKVVSHVDYEGDLTICRTLNEVKRKIDTAFCLTGVDTDWSGDFYPQLMLNHVVLSQSYNEAVKRIIYAHPFDYRAATKGGNLFLTRTNCCYCYNLGPASTREYIEVVHLKTVWDAVRICGVDYPDSVLLTLNVTDLKNKVVELSKRANPCNCDQVQNSLSVVDETVTYVSVEFCR